MLIQDLDFSDFLDRNAKKAFGIGGGASAYADVFAEVDDGSIIVNAYAIATGDLSRSYATTEAKVIANGRYTAGYGTGYSVAYGVTRYDNPESAIDSAIVFI